jgi:hypothetical protein
MFSRKFFKNAAKHCKVVFGNYFPFLENIFQKLFSGNYFMAKQTHPKLERKY